MSRAEYTGPGLNTGLDFTIEELTPDERGRLTRWYEETHGTGDLDLVQVVKYLLKYDPTGLKRYRRGVIACQTPRDGVTLPQAVVVLMFLHLYTLRALTKETLFEIMACRSLGVTKAQIIETLNFAFMGGGGLGINAAADGILPYLDAWDDEGESNVIEWPEGWELGSDALHAGLDRKTLDFLPGEIDALEDWHRRPDGSVPRHVRLWAELHGEPYKAYRLRYEASLGSSLPVQLAPLFTMHIGVWHVWPQVVYRSMLQARKLGIERHHVVQVISWVSFIYGGEWKLEAVLTDEVCDLLENWDSQA